MKIEYYKNFRINIGKPEIQDGEWFVEWDIMTKIRGGWETADGKFSLSVSKSYKEDEVDSIVLQNAIKYIDKNL